MGDGKGMEKEDTEGVVEEEKIQTEERYGGW